MSAERPILFSAPMVRALLERRKSQTRRVVKPQPPTVEQVRAVSGSEFHLFTDRHAPPHVFRVAGSVSVVRDLCGQAEWTCPYGAPGDELWVRETWAKAGEQGDRIEYRADTADPTAGPWRPSIHMPRWASRLTLLVKDVRVERLQAISEADAEAEGVERDRGRDVPAAMGGGIETWRNYLDAGDWRTSARSSYRTLWESINGPGSWAANPWVWCVSFEVRR